MTNEIKKELSELEYGNCDVSAWEGSNINPYKELNGFWLGSSLKISPYEQVEVLSKIFEGKSFYDSQNVEILKKIMLIEDEQEKKVYGKTGSGTNGDVAKKVIINYSNENGKRVDVKFSVHYDSDINKAKKIVMDVIKNCKMEM